MNIIVNKMKKRNWDKIVQHTMNEIQITNILTSLQIADYNLLQKAHDSIHEFIYIAPFCLPQKQSWHSKSAFLTYHYMAYNQAHRSFLEALAGYYNVANIILRSTLELVIKGTFWECLAHKKFRKNAKIIENKARVKIEDKKRTILDWLNDLIQIKPEIENKLEQISVGIFDKIAPLYKNPELEKLLIVLKPRIVLEQLSSWKILDPYNHDDVYRIYKKLSQDVHVIPDKTDIGRRLLQEKDMFETTIIQAELEEFLKLLHKVMDIAIVIELNILSDWIIQLDNKNKLNDR
ncbi:MAG: hypothetical protein J7K83_01480, partial [Candidatus Aenigmarchaeota archaeon]|nr:hypothetical protein [Candidatus Aenigmarchaeota archaeon]